MSLLSHITSSGRDWMSIAAIRWSPVPTANQHYRQVQTKVTFLRNGCILFIHQIAITLDWFGLFYVKYINYQKHHIFISNSSVTYTTWNSECIFHQNIITGINFCKSNLFSFAPHEHTTDVQHKQVSTDTHTPPTNTDISYWFELIRNQLLKK